MEQKTLDRIKTIAVEVLAKLTPEAEQKVLAQIALLPPERQQAMKRLIAAAKLNHELKTAPPPSSLKRRSDRRG